MSTLSQAATCDLPHNSTSMRQLLLNTDSSGGITHILIKSIAIYIPLSGVFATLFGMLMLYTIKKYPVAVVWIALGWAAAILLGMMIAIFAAMRNEAAGMTITGIVFAISVCFTLVFYLLFRKHITMCGRLMGVAAQVIEACPGTTGVALLSMICMLG